MSKLPVTLKPLLCTQDTIYQSIFDDLIVPECEKTRIFDSLGLECVEDKHFV